MRVSLLGEVVLAGLAIAAVTLCVAVGAVLQRRPVDTEEKGALRGFIFWWFGLAFVALFEVVRTLGFQASDHGLVAVRLTIMVIFGIISMMLGGLVYYMVYLYTGKRSWLRPIILFYLLQLAYVVFLFESHDPFIAVEEGRNVIRFETAPVSGNALLFLLMVMLFLPPFAAGIAYGLLFFQVNDRTSRYRIALVSGGIILWFGYSLLSIVTRALVGAGPQGFEGRLIGQSLGVGAALLGLLAYLPPRFVRKLLGVESVIEENEKKDEATHAEKRGLTQ